jgi:hypothetical protein
VSEELRRSFRGKIQGRPPACRRESGAVRDSAAETLPGSVRLRGLEHGLLARAPLLRDYFNPDAHLVRMTLDLGDPQASALAHRPLDLAVLERLAPSLARLSCPDEAPPLTAAASDRFALAHLIEHAAVALQSAVSPIAPVAGATCAYAGPVDRFDLFLACVQPALGRAAALLAMAAVRDLLDGVDRLSVHILTRDLLAFVAVDDRSSWAPEDVTAALGVATTPLRTALESLTRLGYLEAITAPFTFSSPSGLIYRRAAGPLP